MSFKDRLYRLIGMALLVMGMAVPGALGTGRTMELLSCGYALGEYDGGNPGLEYLFTYQLRNSTPGGADADIMTRFSINAPNGTTFSFYRISIVQGDLTYNAGDLSQTAIFTGAIPPADYDADNYFTVRMYAPSTAFISSNGWMEAESSANGPFNTISNVWVPLAGPPTYTLTATSTAHGTISPTNVSVTAGSNALFTIAASNHYRIAEIRANDVSVGALPADLTTTNYTWYNVQSDGTLTATFSPLIRQSHIVNLAVSGATITLAITNLTIESSNAVERTFTLSTDGWNRIGGFITPNTCATNWTGSDTGTTPRFYRIRTLVP